MDYLVVKWLHIISSTILFGTGVGSAFYLFAANRGKQIAHINFAAGQVVIADWLFTTPAIIIQLLSGFYLLHLGGHHFTDKWVAISLGLFVFVGFCWIPVVWMQIKMRDMARKAQLTLEALPDKYWIYDRWWIILGSLAFPAVIAIFWLMVAKPV